MEGGGPPGRHKRRRERVWGDQHRLLSQLAHPPACSSPCYQLCKSLVDLQPGQRARDRCSPQDSRTAPPTPTQHALLRHRPARPRPRRARRRTRGVDRQRRRLLHRRVRGRDRVLRELHVHAARRERALGACSPLLPTCHAALLNHTSLGRVCSSASLASWDCRMCTRPVWKSSSGLRRAGQRVLATFEVVRNCRTHGMWYMSMSLLVAGCRIYLNDT